MSYPTVSMISLRGRRLGATLLSVLVAVAAAGGCKKHPEDDADGPDASVRNSPDGSIGSSGDASNGTKPTEAGAPGRCADVGYDGGTTAPSNVVGGTSPGDPPCNGDWSSGATAACPTRDNGFCSSAGLCGRCGDCAAAPGHAGSQCSGEGICGQPCSDGSTCPAARYCSVNGPTGACLPLHPNGDSVGSSFSPAACTAASKTCASGMTHESGFDCLCGKANGAACASGGECLYDFCSADGKCGGRVGDACHPLPDFSIFTASPCRSDKCEKTSCTCVAACTDDSACGNTQSGKVCDPIAGTCVPGCRTSGGNGCPLGKTCQVDGEAFGECK